MFLILKRALSGSADHDISHEEMVQVVEAKSHQLIDVREPHEYAAGHVVGAINCPLSRFDPAAIDQTRPVILICQAGGRSAKALAQLKKINHPDARHYPPGTGGWRAQGGPVSH
jgi:rhodanese-related sulfurtransferase